MHQTVTEAIILSRIDYGEADRILTLLTPDHGKLTLMAKGVRRVKSKLAGGIELFSVSTITFVKGRGEVGTLVSSRLVKHYGHIVEDLDRTMLGYEFIKRLNKITEDAAGSEYFDLLGQTFAALDALTLSPQLIDFWFSVQLLRLTGHTPNLRTDTAGQKLDPHKNYDFGFDDMAFVDKSDQGGYFNASHIKFLRLGFAGHTPNVLSQVQGGTVLVQQLLPLILTMRQNHLRV